MLALKYGEDKFFKSKLLVKLSKLDRSSRLRHNNGACRDYQICQARQGIKRKKGASSQARFFSHSIEVNDELGAADESIQQAIDMLAVDGRISSHHLPFFGRSLD